MIISKLIDNAKTTYSMNAMRMAYPKHLITIITKSKIVAFKNLIRMERNGSKLQTVKQLPNGKYVVAHN